MADGYRIYRGLGGPDKVDFTSSVGSAAAGASSVSLVGLGHAVSSRYTYVIRPYLGALETPDYSARVEFETDASGDWVGNRPGQVEWIEAEVIASGEIRLRWHYRTPYGAAAPADFGLYYAQEPSIDPGSPQATESYTADGPYSKDLTLADGVTYFFALTARTAAGVESHLSKMIGPFVADSAAPATPGLYTSQSF